MIHSVPQQLTLMIETVAKALGDDLLPKVAFVGGCATSLLVTDTITKEEVRYTNDVDLIVSVIGYVGWETLGSPML